MFCDLSFRISQKVIGSSYGYFSTPKNKYILPFQAEIVGNGTAKSFNLGGGPDVLADERGQVAAIGSLGLERITFVAFRSVSSFSCDLRGYLGFCLDIVKTVVHGEVPLFWHPNLIKRCGLIVYNN